METSLWNKAHNFLFEMKVGDYYLTSSTTKIECTKRTKKKIYLSNNTIVSIKQSSNGYYYLDSRSVVRHNKSYPIVHQILRDIEGFLIYKIHSKRFESL
jgi:hypothetical protein